MNRKTKLLCMAALLIGGGLAVNLFSSNRWAVFLPVAAGFWVLMEAFRVPRK